MFPISGHCMCSYSLKSLVYPRLPVLKAFRKVVVIVIHARPTRHRIVVKASLVCQTHMRRFLVESVLSPIMMVLVHRAFQKGHLCKYLRHMLCFEGLSHTKFLGSPKILISYDLNVQVVESRDPINPCQWSPDIGGPKPEEPSSLPQHAAPATEPPHLHIAESPTPGKLRISAEAVEARMRRVFTPNIRGEFKCSTEIVAQWRDKRKGRKTLQQVFQACGYNVDWGCGWSWGFSMISTSY